MSNKKLTIEQLKNYLGTGLEIMRPDGRTKLILKTVIDNLMVFEGDGWKYGDLIKNKLICYRLSDLDKFIPELGFVPFQELFKNHENMTRGRIKKAKEEILHIPYLSYERLQKLFQWHFWPFGDEYFEQGLVIDKLNQGKEADHG